MDTYKVLSKQVFVTGNYSIVPIRMEDRYDIMKWRNEQIYHLRQSIPLIKEGQDNYFDTLIAKLFEQQEPSQILFSYLEGEKCIGYGGLVHINWIDRNAEVSFIMDTSLQDDFFEFHWQTYLGLIEEVSFRELCLHKIVTYAYDLRPSIYKIFENFGFKKDAVLRDHLILDKKYINVVIHSKINSYE
jgi:RimJ/RimL family protein N-acetyltransferase